jgi:hypothetical protein
MHLEGNTKQTSIFKQSSAAEAWAKATRLKRGRPWKRVNSAGAAGYCCCSSSAAVRRILDALCRAAFTDGSTAPSGTHQSTVLPATTDPAKTPQSCAERHICRVHSRHAATMQMPDHAQHTHQPLAAVHTQLCMRRATPRLKPRAAGLSARVLQTPPS